MSTWEYCCEYLFREHAAAVSQSASRKNDSDPATIATTFTASAGVRGVHSAATIFGEVASRTSVSTKHAAERDAMKTRCRSASNATAPSPA